MVKNIINHMSIPIPNIELFENKTPTIIHKLINNGINYQLNSSAIPSKALVNLLIRLTSDPTKLLLK